MTVRSWVVGYPDMRLTWTQFMARRKELEPLREFRGLEVGLWLQAEARHKGEAPLTKEQLLAQDEAKERYRMHKSIMWGYLFGRRSVRP